MADHHVIIGGGPAATNAIDTIRQFDGGESKITIICDEPTHSRMALPYWLAGSIPREQTYTGDEKYFASKGVETKFGARVTAIDSGANSVTLDNGETITYDKLLIATGSTPLAPPIPGTDLPGVQPLWTLAHTEAVLQATAAIEKPRVVLVGAGFIGFIMLNAMYKKGWDLTVVEREEQVLPRMLNGSAAAIVQDWLARRGVGVFTGVNVEAIHENDGAKSVQLSNGENLDADIVIIATGVQPNVELAQAAGLETDHGILVNDSMQTSVSNIYAAGDCAQGAVLLSDKREVHAIQPTAVDHGRVAGANMAGQSVAYPGSLIMNVVDVCGLQCASYGNWEDTSGGDTSIDNPAGHIYRQYLWNGGQMVGAIFLGRPNDMGMLTDVGMVKGIIQTMTDLGQWKNYLNDNPFDIRRAYIGAGVAQKLIGYTLVGKPTPSRDYRYNNTKVEVPANKAHSVYIADSK
ncbi:MAG: NAD(P)H-nitrite reductase large subunit [Pirellulaceae bacterium]|jgi:NAD(P)H-nitrite reductase large subunit